ncbi:MAG TPA: threonine ammonia-lyase [Actinomycetota bacterium]|nr:threonine ammonia-lyase [Actinomycetota bacterium]
MITAETLAQAQSRLAGIVVHTPMLPARWLSDLVGGPVYLKCENLQRTGSFKMRGAYNRIAQLNDEERARGVVAASAGNHAQGVALAAEMLGVRSTIFMPEGATLPKIEATIGYGAEVRFAGTTVDEALVAATEHSRATGAILIHPFDHVDVVAGQATVGLEIAEQQPDVRTVVVCTGGGGLLAGVCLGVAGVPDVRVVGVQAVQAASYPPSIAAGHPLQLEQMNTMADGIAVARPGELPFGIITRAGVDFLTVDDEQISRAVVQCLERSKLVVEPAGAAGVAALMAHPGAFEPPVVVTLSGGNVDPLLLLRIVQRGLVAARRYMVISAFIPDRPGHLEAILAEIADRKANVVTVSHNRVDPRLRVDECAVVVEVEVRGPEHAAEVLSGLRAHGFTVSVE